MKAASVFDIATVPALLKTLGYVVPDNAKRLMKCPFHRDGTPSLRVFAKGYRCFGCGRHGGVADLVIELGFADDHRGAARWLEERVG